jgi:hypothetical protein
MYKNVQKRSIFWNEQPICENFVGMEYGERAVEISEDHPTAQKW